LRMKGSGHGLRILCHSACIDCNGAAPGHNMFTLVQPIRIMIEDGPFSYAYLAPPTGRAAFWLSRNSDHGVLLTSRYWSVYSSGRRPSQVVARIWAVPEQERGSVILAKAVSYVTASVENIM
jgi:hypothetical protein